MKIDSDLRCAIKAAERAQPSSDWTHERKNEQAAILAFFKKFPDKAKRTKALIKSAQYHEAAQTKAQKTLCDLFGLRRSEGTETGVAFSHCGGNADRFEKAGGKIPIKHSRWKADIVIARLAAATPKEAKQIIKSIGINWE